MEELAAKQVLLDIEIITLIAVAIGVLIYSMVRRPAGTGIPVTPNWDGIDLGLMLFPAFIFLMGPIGMVVAAQAEMSAPVEEASDGLMPLFVNLGVFAFVGLMVYGIVEWIRDRRVVEVFGLKVLGFPQIVVCTIIGGVLSLVICVWLVGSVSQWWLSGLFEGLEEQEPVKSFQNAKSTLFLSLSIVNACIAAPLAEEFLFRGYMYGALKNATGRLFSTMATSLIFAVVHGNLPAFLPLFIFSILLCLAYEATRSLWVPIGMHAFFNGANIVLMMVDQQIE